MRAPILPRLIVALTILLAPQTLWAQQVPSPPGAIGGLFGGRRPLTDPSRASSRWTVTFLGSGGVDQEPVELGLGDAQAPSVSGNAATISASTRFTRGRPGRQLEMNADGFLNRQELQTGQMRGASGRIQGQYDPNRRLGVTGMASVSYQPLMIGQPVLTGGPASVAPADSLGPPPGVEEELWISTTGTATITRGWTPRQRLELNYTDYRSQPVQGAGLNSRSVIASAREVWDATPRFQLRVGYNYEETTQDGGGIAAAPTKIQSVNLGFDFERPMGPSRSLRFIVESGADFAEAHPALDAPVEQSVMPSVAGSVEWQFSQRWTVSVGGSHEATVLPGITPAPFTTDQASLQVSGTIVERLTLSMFGSFSKGTTLEGQEGSYRASTATAQINYGLSRCCAMFTSFNYYDHRLQDLSNAATGIPGSYARYTARVGFSYWLPLYGTF